MPKKQHGLGKLQPPSRKRIATKLVLPVHNVNHAVGLHDNQPYGLKIGLSNPQDGGKYA